jgi:PAS domain S-box-containing protein
MDSTLDRTHLTGVERILERDAIIVSKTDRRGIITYANDTFLAMTGYTEAEVLGAPHSLLRHPAMPRSVFALLWDRIEAGRDVFAIVVNRAKNGDHYWVHAHVTPSLGPDGTIRGYHSFRRAVSREVVGQVEAVYERVVAEELRHSTKKAQARAGLALLEKTFGDLGRSYDRWSWSVAP